MDPQSHPDAALIIQQYDDFLQHPPSDIEEEDEFIVRRPAQTLQSMVRDWPPQSYLEPEGRNRKRPLEAPRLDLYPERKVKMKATPRYEEYLRFYLHVKYIEHQCSVMLCMISNQTRILKILDDYEADLQFVLQSTGYDHFNVSLELDTLYPLIIPQIIQFILQMYSITIDQFENFAHQFNALSAKKFRNDIAENLLEYDLQWHRLHFTQLIETYEVGPPEEYWTTVESQRAVGDFFAKFLRLYYYWVDAKLVSALSKDMFDEALAHLKFAFIGYNYLSESVRTQLEQYTLQITGEIMSLSGGLEALETDFTFDGWIYNPLTWKRPEIPFASRDIRTLFQYAMYMFCGRMHILGFPTASFMGLIHAMEVRDLKMRDMYAVGTDLLKAELTEQMNEIVSAMQDHAEDAQDVLREIQLRKEAAEEQLDLLFEEFGVRYYGLQVTVAHDNFSLALLYYLGDLIKGLKVNHGKFDGFVYIEPANRKVIEIHDQLANAYHKTHEFQQKRKQLQTRWSIDPRRFASVYFDTAAEGDNNNTT